MHSLTAFIRLAVNGYVLVDRVNLATAAQLSGGGKHIDATIAHGSAAGFEVLKGVRDIARGDFLPVSVRVDEDLGGHGGTVLEQLLGIF